MNEASRVGIYYGKGPNFPDRLKALRARYPQGHVTLVVPAGLLVSEADWVWVDDVFHTELENYSPKAWRECLRLVATLRKRRFDVFVVSYDTLQLRMLAGLSGAGRCECWAPDSIIIPMGAWAAFVLPGKVLRVLRGHLRVVGLMAVTYLAPVGKR